MARPKATIPTERFCVTLPAGEVKAAKAAAQEVGVTWAEFARRALADAVARRTPGVRGTITQVWVEEKPGRLAKAAILTPVEQHQLHEHVASKMLSGGIHCCTVKGCEARKVGGRWIEGA